MKKSIFIKIISLALAMIMAMACIASCTNSGSGEESGTTEITEDITKGTEGTTAATDKATTDTEKATTDTEKATTDTEKATTDTEAETDEPTKPEEVKILPLIANGKTEYTIVTPNSVNADIAIATNELKCLFATMAKTAINIKTVKEFSFLTEGKFNKPKIIIGSIAEDPDSVDMRYALASGEFIIKFTNNTLYITGKSNADTMRAWEYFKLTYFYNGITDLAFEDGFCYESKSAQVDDIKIEGTPISEYRIVYCNDSYHAKKYSELLRNAIYRKTGITVSVSPDTTEPKEHEILLGKTNRTESAAVRADYDRPNLYYDIKTLGGKLVVMGEGYKTLEHVVAEFDRYINAISASTDISGSVVKGNVRDFVDTTTMMDAAEGTDLRVFHYNMAAPLIYNENAIYKNDTERGEAIADMVLAYYPDIITTDEIYNSKQTAHHKNLYSAVMKELDDYYNIVDPSPYDDGTPVEGTVGDFNYGINENILYKKELGLTLLGSGWRYGSTKVDGENITKYLGFHSAAFEMTDGTKFIVSPGHYGDSGSTDIWAKEHHQNIAALREKLGLDENVPTILTGDMFTVKGRAAYKYHEAQGYMDAQQTALVKCNFSARGDLIKTHGTFHDVGTRQTSRAAEDFVWYDSSFEALQFKVIASELSDRTSDHYPVCADLKFK